MAQRPTHVPKFGDWNTEQDTPYTSVFENARVGKGAGGKIINPNDPEENPSGFAQTVQRNNISAQLPRKNSDPEDSIQGRPHPSPRRGTNSELNSTHVAKPRHEKRSSREDGVIGYHSPAPGRRGSGESPGHQYANTNNLQRRERGTREHHYRSQDQSPAHHLYEGLENKPGAGAMFSPSTTGQKSRGGNIRANETEIGKMKEALVNEDLDRGGAMRIHKTSILRHTTITVLGRLKNVNTCTSGFLQRTYNKKS